MEYLEASITAMIAAITVTIAAWLTGLLNQFVPSPSRTWLAIGNVLRERSGDPEDGFRIVLCWLENDSRGIDTRQVENAFAGVAGIALVRSSRIVKGSGAWNEWSESMQRQARAVLEDWHADLAVVGLVKESGKTLSLWFVPRLGPGTLERGDAPYRLDAVTLGEDFHGDLRAQLTAFALAAVGPLADTEVRGQVWEKGLWDETKKLSTLLEGGAIRSDEQQGSLHLALGVALWALGERKSDTELLEKAVAEQRAALKVHTRERAPPVWAITQMWLGVALSDLGERKSGTRHLEEGVGAFHAALEVQTRERMPLEWATTQARLGATLTTLAERGAGTEQLEEAVEAYRAALKVNTRRRTPLEWAKTQMNLGNALWKLGERGGGTKRLQEAVDAYHAALEVRTRERVPLQWARTQTNLGAALTTWGKNEAETKRLEEGVAAYRAALEERTRERQPREWARTQTSLGDALSILGERETGTKRLKEAVVAYRAALEERTREREPLQWATTQSNLGYTLAILGERETGTERLEEAVAVCCSVLKECTTEKMSQHRIFVQSILDDARGKLHSRRSNPPSCH